MNLLPAFHDKEKEPCPSKLQRSRGFTRLVDFDDATKSRTKRASSKFTTGFTLIEILVVLGIVVLIVAMVLVANFGQYTRQVSRSEVSALVSALQKARSRSMNNIDATTHGVYFGFATTDPCPDTTNYPHCYVIFQGSDYTSSDSDYHEYADRNPAFTLTSDLEEIVFEQLSGNPIDVTDGEIIDLVGAGESGTIILNEQGLINW